MLVNKWIHHSIEFRISGSVSGSNEKIRKARHVDLILSKRGIMMAYYEVIFSPTELQIS